MSTHEAHGCSECNGRGWLVMFNTDTHALELQRCDACAKFESDLDAQQWVTSNVAEHIAVLRELCGAVFSEVQRALTEESASRDSTTRALTTIRNSLRGVLALASDLVPEAESTSGASPVMRCSASAEKRTYIVGVREVHVRHYEVDAADPVEAKAMVSDRRPEVTDIGFEEYSHELGPDSLSVEEKL
ncbi:MAG: hypothetical protein AMXMBFR84_48350 [Candidatus Hydrogenedentota bacterium]